VKNYWKDNSKRKWLFGLAAAILVVVAIAALGLIRAQGASSDLEYATITRGNLAQTVEAIGMVRARQSAELKWKTSGTVENAMITPGQQVTAGQVLISLEKNSLSTNVILAQANLVAAEKALQDLKTSRIQQAQAMKALEDARQAWEDAQNPILAQANAQNAVASAQKELDEAERLLAITSSTPSAEAISQAKANLLLAENVYNQTLQDMERIQKKLKKPESAYMFFESRKLYQRILDSLEQKEIRDRRAYEKAQEKYNQLLEPVDPLDLAVAEANVIAAQAKLDDAQRQWERIQDGYSPGELAVLKAELEDAEREWARLKDGPHADDIRAAEAKVAAAQAILDQSHIVAPFNGVITRVDNRAGDQVRSGTSALRLDDLSHLYVDGNVSEIDIHQIRLGQKAVLTFDSIPAWIANTTDAPNQGTTTPVTEYPGAVVDVALVGDQTEQTVQYTVVIEIDQPDALIRPGASAEALIIVNEFQDVLQVPNRALHYKGAQRYVFVERLGQPQPVEVDLGVISGDYSEVLAGDLQPGDRVVLDPPEWLTAGLQ
jgi:HlyD family secretion protein